MDAETLSQLRQSVRRYVRDRLVPLEGEVAANDRIPDAVHHELAQLGLFGMSIPERYGGLGLDLAGEIELAFELGWTSPAFRSRIGSSNGIGSQGILMDGTEAQKEKWLPKIATGALTASFALTEPEAGSDAASLRTSARRDGDHYIVNGTKRFISNAPDAGMFTLLARTDSTDKTARGISAFIVDATTSGIHIGKPDRKMGQHGALTADVIFENARVPADNLIGGQEGLGFKTAMKVLDRGRLHLAAVCCGVAERLIHEALTYASARHQFGRAIAEFQLVQAMLADSRTEAYAAWSMTRDAAARYDRRLPTSMQAAACKYYASEMVGRVADRAVQIHGGAGYMADSAVERFYRDVRLFRIYEGTSQILQLVIARNMLRDSDQAS